MRILLPLLLGGLLLTFACRKDPGPPSPDWERARALHLDLLARYSDDAYGRSEMEEVLTLLDRVPLGSIDAPMAAALKIRINEERARFAARQEERQRLIAAAGPANWSGSSAAGGVSPAGESPQAAVAAISEKPALVPGLALDAFRQSYGDCFESRTQLRIEKADGGVVSQKGEAFGLKSDPACQAQYQQLADKMVVFADGKLMAVRPSADVKTVQQEVLEPPKPIEVEAEIGPDGKLVPKRGLDGGYIPIKKGGSTPGGGSAQDSRP